jgi:PTS system nitrogen regulatory IIA component
MQMLLNLPMEAIIPDLTAATRDDVLSELADNVASRCPHLSSLEIVRVLKERELLGSTGIGDGVAIPHGKLRDMRSAPILAVGRTVEGIDFNSIDDRKVHLFFLLLASDDDAGVHLRILARLSRILKNPAVRKGLLLANGAAEIHALLLEQERLF